MNIDISPHGYPDDNYKVTKETRLEDLCATKFLVTKHMVEDLVAAFPNTRWAYALGWSIMHICLQYVEYVVFMRTYLVEVVPYKCHAQEMSTKIATGLSIVNILIRNAHVLALFKY